MSITATNLSTMTATANTVTTENDSSILSMNDFFELLVAQLQNQNMLDPIDNTEFIAQMAQFSTLSQMQEMSSVCQMSYAVSLLGKNVMVSSTDENGVTVLSSGIVDNVIYQSNVPYIQIDGVSYLTSDVLSIADVIAATEGAVTEELPASETTPSEDEPGEAGAANDSAPEDGFPLANETGTGGESE